MGFTFARPAATDNTAVAGYEASIDGGVNYSLIGNVLTLSETRLAPSTLYNLRIRAVNAAGNKATPLSATATTTAAALTAVRSISVPLQSAGVPAANLSGLTWALFDKPTPGAPQAPVAKGSNAGTNAAGMLSLSLPGSALLAGGTGYLHVSDTNGTTSYAARAFSGPVQVQ